MTVLFPPYILEYVKYAGSLCDAMGVNSYVVGGGVRDILLKRKNNDIDILIEGDAIESAKRANLKFRGELTVFKDFGTAKIRLNDGVNLDFSRARKEEYAKPAVLPNVREGTLNDDLFRRDFTINAMAIGAGKKNFGRLYDYYAGLKDLKEGLIRVMHDNSFIDDPTRIFRAVRYAGRYGFSIEEKTSALIIDADRSEVISLLTPARVINELVRIFKENKFIEILKVAQKYNLPRSISREFCFKESNTKILEKADKVISWHSRKMFKEKIEEWVIRFIYFVHDAGKTAVEEFCAEYKASNEIKRKLIQAKILQCQILDEIRGSEKRSGIYALLKDFDEEPILCALGIAGDAKTAKKIKDYMLSARYVKTAVSGDDLEKMGIRKGPIYAEILKKVLYAKIDGMITARAEEFDFVKRNYL